MLYKVLNKQGKHFINLQPITLIGTYAEDTAILATDPKI